MKKLLKSYFRLYLAYTDLILIFKIEPIALVITSLLIDPGVQPATYMLYYIGLTLFIHLPSMIYSAKKIVMYRKIQRATTARRFRRYSRIHFNNGVLFLASPKGQAIGVGISVVGSTVGMYLAYKGSAASVEFIEGAQRAVENQQQVILIYEELLQKHQKEIQDLQATLQQYQEKLKQYEDFAEKQGELLAEVYKTQMKFSETVVNALSEKIAELSGKVGSIEEELKNPSGFWKYFTYEHWLGGGTIDFNVEISGFPGSTEEESIDNALDDEISELPGSTEEESIDKLIESMPIAPTSEIAPNDMSDEEKIRDLNRRLEALNSRDSTTPES